jgi:hypothetical protein
VFRCGVVYGHNKDETQQRHREELLCQLHEAHEEYAQDPFCVPSEWAYIFHRPLISYQSAGEAKQQQALLSCQQQIAKGFFAPSAQYDEVSSCSNSSFLSPDDSSLDRDEDCSFQESQSVSLLESQLGPLYQGGEGSDLGIDDGLGSTSSSSSFSSDYLASVYS